MPHSQPNRDIGEPSCVAQIKLATWEGVPVAQLRTRIQEIAIDRLAY
jgi:hypothetical protein